MALCLPISDSGDQIWHTLSVGGPRRSGVALLPSSSVHQLGNTCANQLGWQDEEEEEAAPGAGRVIPEDMRELHHSHWRIWQPI